MRHGLLAIAFILGYLTLSLPQVTFITQIGFTAWYPAIGLVLALLLGVSPGYAVVAIAADSLASLFIYHQPLRSYSGILGVTGCASCYALGAFVLRGRFRIDPGLPRRQDVVRYLSVTAIMAIPSTVVGVSCLLADRTIGAREYWPSMLEWFIGDGIGVVGVAPFLLIYVLPWVRGRLNPLTVDGARPTGGELKISIKTLMQVTAQGLSLAGVLWIMFSPRFGNDKLFLGLVPIVWIAMRFGIRGAAAATLALNFGVVVAMRIFPPSTPQLRTVGLLMLVVSSVGLLVGASVTERERIAHELNERTSYLDSVIENSAFGMVVLEADGRVKFVNRPFEQLTLCTQAELAGSRLDALFSPDTRTDMPDEWYAKIVAGQTLHHTFTWSRRDGSVVDLGMDAVPLTVDGLMRGAYVICKDISQEIQAAEAERKHTESLNRLVCELEFRTSQMAVLNEMGSLLECCTTLSEAGEVTSHSIRKLFPEAISGAFLMFENSTNQVETLAGWGATEESRASQFGLQDCWALRRGRAHWSAEGQGVVCQHVMPPGPNQFLCLPLSGKEGSLGILQLEFPPEEGWIVDSGPEGRQQSLERLGITVAGQLAHSIASLKLRQTLRDQSIRDALTGLYNRRFMVESLDRELLRASRNGTRLSILFIDLDNFKRFNDTFGHEAGDFVLRTMGGVFQDFFRGNDLICRYGGEEFAIVLPDCTSKDAAARADALRARVRSVPLKYQGQTLNTVTLSIGVAAFPESGATVNELLKVADDCLYRSKANGRDATTEATGLQVTS
jgi:diguanylate cyclase (GGDEF)-like protein/PAS domain S-box-containing protein